MTEASTVTLTASVLLRHHVGLHARPSVKLTKLAKGYAARLELSAGPDGPWIDAKSIVRVMAMKAPKDTVLHFRADGPDARAALDGLVALVERDFDEGEG